MGSVLLPGKPHGMRLCPLGINMPSAWAGLWAGCAACKTQATVTSQLLGSGLLDTLEGSGLEASALLLK